MHNSHSAMEYGPWYNPFQITRVLNYFPYPLLIWDKMTCLELTIFKYWYIFLYIVSNVISVISTYMFYVPR